MNCEFYNRDAVSKIIEDYCKSHGITEADFAVLINVHPAHLPRIKAGKMSSLEVLCKIAILGKVQLHDLLNKIPERIKQEIQLIGREKNIPVAV